MSIKISLAQLSFHLGEEKENVKKAVEAIEQAAQSGSDLILLPELWSSGYDLKNWRKYATPIDQGVFAVTKGLAQKNRIAIGSSLLELKDGRAYNSFVIFDRDGVLWPVYRKIHRFRLLNEEKWLAAGDRLVIADSCWGKIGLAICYDLRFPEMFRPYAEAGACLLLVVAEWPVKRVIHWSKLLQARAIENQMFVAGVNKVGESMGVQLGGRSAIINPWGEPIVEGGQEELLLTAEIDLHEAIKAREVIPVFEDLKPEIYKKGVEG
jgi:predicted amidohydrolase